MVIVGLVVLFLLGYDQVDDSKSSSTRQIIGGLMMAVAVGLGAWLAIALR